MRVRVRVCVSIHSFISVVVVSKQIKLLSHVSCGEFAAVLRFFIRGSSSVDRVVVFSILTHILRVYLYITYVHQVNILHYFMSILNKASKPKKSSETHVF